MSRTRAVLVDLYDTLVWSDWPKLRALIEERTGLSTRALLGAFDHTRPARSVGTFANTQEDLGAVLRSAGLEPSVELLDNLAGLVVATLANGVHLWEDSIPTLRELHRRGIGTAVVSNCDHSTRPEVERLGLVEETDAVILSFEVGAAKPMPEIYLAALEAVGARPADALFVDDQADYCDGAAALGIATAIVLREDASPGEGTSEPGGHRVIADLRSLLELV